MTGDEDSAAIPAARLKATGLTRLMRATGYSLAGLRAALASEAAFRQELILAGVLIPLAFFIAGTAAELALLIGTLFIVLIVELLNSALESVVDRVGLEVNELSGRAKDMGSAAVMLSCVLVVVVWALVMFYGGQG